MSSSAEEQGPEKLDDGENASSSPALSSDETNDGTNGEGSLTFNAASGTNPSQSSQAQLNQAQSFAGVSKNNFGSRRNAYEDYKSEATGKGFLSGKSGNLQNRSRQNGNESAPQNAHSPSFALPALLNPPAIPVTSATIGLRQNFAGAVPVALSLSNNHLGIGGEDQSPSLVTNIFSSAPQGTSSGSAMVAAKSTAMGPAQAGFPQTNNNAPESAAAAESNLDEADSIPESFNVTNLNSKTTNSIEGWIGGRHASQNPPIQNIPASSGQRINPQQTQNDATGQMAEAPLSAAQASPDQLFEKENERGDAGSSPDISATAQGSGTKQTVIAPTNTGSIQSAAAIQSAAVPAAWANAFSLHGNLSPHIKTKGGTATQGAAPHSAAHTASADSGVLPPENDSAMQISTVFDQDTGTVSDPAPAGPAGTSTTDFAFASTTNNLTVQINGPTPGHGTFDSKAVNQPGAGSFSASATAGTSSNAPTVPATNSPNPGGVPNSSGNGAILSNAIAGTGLLNPAGTTGARRNAASGPLMQNASAESAFADKVKTGDVHAARIWEHAGQTEMRIGMKTDDFGKVEVRTQLRDSQVGVAVESERGDLKSYFTPELPGLQNTLHQHSLHLESMDFSNQSRQPASSQGENYRGGSAGSFDGERQSHAPPESFPAQVSTSSSVSSEVTDALSLEPAWPRQNGINIHV